MNSTAVRAMLTGPDCTGCQPKYRIVDDTGTLYSQSFVAVEPTNGSFIVQTFAGFKAPKLFFEYYFDEKCDFVIGKKFPLTFEVCGTEDVTALVKTPIVKTVIIGENQTDIEFNAAEINAMFNTTGPQCNLTYFISGSSSGDPAVNPTWLTKYNFDSSLTKLVI